MKKFHRKNHMESRRRLFLRPRTAAWLVGIIVLLVAVAASVGLFGGKGNSIVLPTGSGESEQMTQEKQEFTLTDADITVENVQQVIESLNRPEAYSMAIDNTVFWNQDWSTCQVNRYVRDGISLTEYLNTTQETERYEMIDGDTYYSWRIGKKKYHTGSTGSLSADQTSMIPTYETILDANSEEITNAGVRTIDGIPCVYCVLEDKDSGYTITYSVSTITGLLLQAEYTRGDELVRSVSVTALDSSVPDESLFALPDGTNFVMSAAGTDLTTADASTDTSEAADTVATDAATTDAGTADTAADTATADTTTDDTATTNTETTNVVTTDN